MASIKDVSFRCFWINPFSAVFADCFHWRDTLYRLNSIQIDGIVDHLSLFVQHKFQGKNFRLCGMVQLRLALAVTQIVAPTIIYVHCGFVIAKVMLIVDCILLKCKDWSGKNWSNSAGRRSKAFLSQTYTGQVQLTSGSILRWHCRQLTINDHAGYLFLLLVSIFDNWGKPCAFS